MSTSNTPRMSDSHHGAILDRGRALAIAAVAEWLVSDWFDTHFKEAPPPVWANELADELRKGQAELPDGLAALARMLAAAREEGAAKERARILALSFGHQFEAANRARVSERIVRVADIEKGQGDAD